MEPTEKVKCFTDSSIPMLLQSWEGGSSKRSAEAHRPVSMAYPEGNKQRDTASNRSEGKDSYLMLPFCPPMVYVHIHTHARAHASTHRCMNMNI